MRRSDEGSACRSGIKYMKQEYITAWCWRIAFYAIGTVLLAVGLTLNTKTGLGTAPIISTPFAVSQIWNVNFAGCVFTVYTIMTLLQFVLKHEWKIFLQIPFSIVFSGLLNLFGSVLDVHYTYLWQNLLLLAAAIIITAVGVSMMVNMKLIANPADGFANTVGELLGKGMGLGKNIVDISFVILTIVLTLAVSGHVIGIGLGTLFSMVGVGRVIALFQHFCQEKMLGKVKPTLS